MALYDSPVGRYPPRRSRLSLATHYLLRMASVRSSRVALFLLLIVCAILALIWRDLIDLNLSRTTHFRGPFSLQSTISSYRGGQGHFSPFSTWKHTPETTNTSTEAANSISPPPAFHLLIPATESNPLLCKTLLSSFLLDYPPPTLVNFKKTFDASADQDNGTHTAKIRGVYNYLVNGTRMGSDDIVLIVDGYDVWFQLAPEILIQRYGQSVEEANERWLKAYGPASNTPNPWPTTDRKPKFDQRVIYATDKECWPNKKEDPACLSIPESTLGLDAWGKMTDKDPAHFLTRPRYLNSGTVIGPVKDLQALYKYATYKVEEENKGLFGDQFVFAEIFGEQEYQRKLTAGPSHELVSDRWKQWLAAKLTSEDGTADNITEVIIPKNMTAIPGRRYEYGLGLDYEMAMFQTMTHSHADVDFLLFNESSGFPTILAEHKIEASYQIGMPSDILAGPAPISYASHNSSGNPNATRLSEYTWETIPLGTNLRVPTVPALLHFNGDKSYLQTWWPRMWFYPEGRALLHAYINTPHPSRWDDRGGIGGAWTDDGQWLSWGELCGGYEEEVFGDGLGRWNHEGLEEGDDGKEYNAFGELLSEVDDGLK